MTPSVILLVEDNPDDAELTVRAFKMSHIANEVVVVRDGVEALDYLFARGTYTSRSVEDVPRVVLLDLNLPKVNGLEVLRAMRDDGRTALVPVVILTSSKEDEDVIQSYSLGANAYVRKPVNFSEFARAAKTLGLFWLLLNEHPIRPAPGGSK